MEYKFTVRTNRVGSNVSATMDIPDDELENISEEEKEKILGDYLNDWVWDHIEAWYEPV
jgi:hypothetical protein